MTDAVLIPGFGMWASLIGIMLIGIAGGCILYICERFAAKHRTEH